MESTVLFLVPFCTLLLDAPPPPCPWQPLPLHLPQQGQHLIMGVDRRRAAQDVQARALLTLVSPHGLPRTMFFVGYVRQGLPCFCGSALLFLAHSRDSSSGLEQHPIHPHRL